MHRFNSSVMLGVAFAYSIFMSFKSIELFYFLPILYVAFFEYKNLGKILKKLLFLNLFLIMIFIVLSLQGSFEDALTIYLRSNMIILFNLTLFSCSNGFDIVRALNELRFPKKFVSSVYFTLKMIQTLNDEFVKMRATLKARGFHASTSFFTYETYGNLFGHIFIKSIRKANALQDSFHLRGFDGRIYLISSTKINLYDIGLLFLVVMLYVKEVVV